MLERLSSKYHSQRETIPGSQPLHREAAPSSLAIVPTVPMRPLNIAFPISDEDAMQGLAKQIWLLQFAFVETQK